jgi:hypothetical protein
MPPRRTTTLSILLSRPFGFGGRPSALRLAIGPQRGFRASGLSSGLRLPPPCPSFPEGTPRWRWEEVDANLANRPRVRTIEEQVELGERLAEAYITKRKRRRCVE